MALPTLLKLFGRDSWSKWAEQHLRREVILDEVLDHQKDLIEPLQAETGVLDLFNSSEDSSENGADIVKQKHIPNQVDSVYWHFIH